MIKIKFGVPARFLLVGASQYERHHVRVKLPKNIAIFKLFFCVFLSWDFDLKAHLINSLWLFKNLASKQKNIKWQMKGRFVPDKVSQYPKQWSSLQLIIQLYLFFE